MIKLFDEIPYIEYGDITLSKVVPSDVPGLAELTSDDMVYKYLPTFLFEKQFSDMNEVVSGIYRDIFESKESLILGIHRKGSDELAGLAEFYGFKDSIHKISIGYRLSQRFWRRTVSILLSPVQMRTGDLRNRLRQINGSDEQGGPLCIRRYSATT